MSISDRTDDVFPAAYRAAQQEQARSLKAAAEEAGLSFSAYLAPRDALWALEAIEKGFFLSPSELVAVAVQQFIEMSEEPDLQQELLGRTLQKALDDPSPSIPMEEVFAALEARMDAIDRQQPAQWQEVGREHLPSEAE